jgi:hypothetical protein
MKDTFPPENMILWLTGYDRERYTTGSFKGYPEDFYKEKSQD